MVLLAAQADEELIHVEQALRESEDRYHALISAISSILWIANGDGAFVARQPFWEAYTGQKWPAYSGYAWLEAIHPADRDIVLQNWRRAIKAKTNYRDEGRLWHEPSQQYRSFIVRAAPVFDPEGSVHEWVGTIDDVQDYKLTKTALDESEERRLLALSAANLGTWYRDFHKNTILWDERCAALFGVSKKEITVDEWRALIHIDDRDRVEHAVAAAVEKGEEYDVEYRITRGGDTRWLRVRGKAFGACDSGHLRMHGTSHDVTERVLATQTLERAVIEKENLLQQKETLLEEMNHRVKNSLQLVTSLINLQANKVASPEGREAFNNTANRIKTISEIHQRLYETKNFTQIEFGQFLNDLGNRFMRSAFTDPNACRLTIQAEAAELPTGTAVSLGLITNELLTNMAKHSADATKQIEATINFRREGAYYKLDVTDSGKGLPESFDPGTSKGLGMRIIKSLAQQLGGTLDVLPQETGSHFCITIPLPKPE